MITNLWVKRYLRLVHSDLNDQNSFHSTIDALPGVSKNLEDQTEDNFGELER